VAAIFPEAALCYGLHDALKKGYTAVTHEEPGVAPSLAFGVLSAFCGQLVSFPLETVSRRLQVGPGLAGSVC
jgi:solute carrier family 25 phosphate transporter 23/24/25/41